MNKSKIKQDLQIREQDDELMAFGFLFSAYRPKMWWFEIFDTIRRLMLTGVLGTISPGTGSQLIAGMLISGVSCGVYAWFKPYVASELFEFSFLFFVRFEACCYRSYN